MRYSLNVLIRCITLIVDAAFFIALCVAAPIMWLVRRIGLQRLPACRLLLSRLGVVPVRRHYYDPYVDASLLKTPLHEARDLPGVDWNVAGQLTLLSHMTFSDELSRYRSKAKSGRCFHFENGSFESGDAEFLYQFVRLKKPKRVVEIGSGYSTLIVRDALTENRREDPSRICEHVCIEPFEMPWLEEAGVKTVRALVENVSMSLFESLDSGDLLFIDSSHVIRPQGDVLAEYLRILPRLKVGVYVHIHDVFSPRDYPADWVLGRMWFWNEQYLVETMLSHGSSWEVVAALNYLKHEHFGELSSVCPYLTSVREPGSIYLQKRVVEKVCE